MCKYRQYIVFISGIIHGDFNESNIVTRDNDVSAILDFGDSHYGPYIFEISIGLTYLLILTGDFTLGKHFLNGYTEERKLTELEEKIITVSYIRLYLCTTVISKYDVIQ